MINKGDKVKVTWSKSFYTGTEKRIPTGTKGEVRSINKGFAYVYFGVGLSSRIKLSHLKTVKEVR